MGHLQNMIAMIGAKQICVDVARQPCTVGQALNAAKNLRIRDNLGYGMECIAEVKPIIMRTSRPA